MSSILAENDCTATPVSLTASLTGLAYLETDNAILPLSGYSAAGVPSTTRYRTQDNCIQVNINAIGCKTDPCTTVAGTPGVQLHLLYNTDGGNDFIPVEPIPCEALTDAAISIADIDTEIQTNLGGLIPVPTTTLDAQPPGGTTLVNFPSLFHVEPPAATSDGRTWTFAYTAAGGRVPVSITGTAHYTFDFGDGTAPLYTSDPGALYQHNGLDPRFYPASYPVTHYYKQPATGLTVKATTTWTFTYALPTGTVRAVPGNVSRTSTIPVNVIEQRARLVDPNNPSDTDNSTECSDEHPCVSATG